MRKRSLRYSIFLFCALSAPGQTPASQAREAASPPVIEETTPPPFNGYPLGPDSKPQPSVPKGISFDFRLTDSRIFPNTTRTISVYVPAAYRADRPACTFVFLDGIGFNAQTVLDNLIAQHAMPVTIAIGVSPGAVDSREPGTNPRFDRSLEFDSMTGRLGRLLLEEVIPAVERHRTPDGLPIRLSDNPDDRAIGGGSTGGIGAFTVAWQHPEAFHRVFSAVGTFVGMRGGERYYVLVRKTEPRPLRIFLEDGVNDEWEGAEMGDWWMSNLTMSRALDFAGYDVRHVWGAGTHNGAHAASIFPDAMRWLWRDWPAPVTARPPGNRELKAVVLQGESWQLAATGCRSSTDLAADPSGRVFYGGDRSVPPLPEAAAGDPVRCDEAGGGQAFAFGGDGALYRSRPQGGIERLPGSGGMPTGAASVGSLAIRRLTVGSSGSIYALAETPGGDGQLWLIPAHGAARMLDEGLKDARGLALSPDGLWLFVSRFASRLGVSYRVLPDGGVDAREPFYDLYLPSDADGGGATQIAMDRDGRAYVATSMGIQVFDRNGRVTAILPLPGGEAATGVCFGGRDFDTLYVRAGDRIYRRRVGVRGAPPWMAPIRLPQWSAG